ncbi:MAG: hypothetical protein A3J38_02560 [Gammaproteobacteria bacterium RIFCSPHIGHO2_12_FULL_45_9]|nr:MAG: hypothetical protein A3J38_02560 [Gammaproteobacteria bacterium RIFCSPHIGHO2_12_FULL_45_9]
MQKRELLGVIVGVGLMSGLTGCGTSTTSWEQPNAAAYAPVSTGTQWENYQCHAVNTATNVQYLGWSTPEDAARSMAMAKCVDHGGTKALCQVTDCVNAS